MLGREKEMAIIPAAEPKKIMVVGGGPGGLNTAWVAAKRGHDVHVYEKRNELGGQLVPGSTPGHKAELRSLIQFQKRQAELFGVTCHLNHEVTAEDIQAENPDIVILATGSLPALPPVEGIGKEIVLTYEDVLDGRPTDFREVVIIGGGPTGLELALHLSEQGNTVTVIEMLPRAGVGLEAMTKKIIFSKLNQNNVIVSNNTKLLRIEDDGVVVTDPDESERFIKADKVLIAIGTRPNNGLYEKVKALGFETYQIGDCLEPRNAKDAIYESAVLGRKL
jgi:pyruvate/2-oxoglutarate dehydrogenase complex dihydrolipoamide dehydrogenase (E3) component